MVYAAAWSTWARMSCGKHVSNVSSPASSGIVTFLLVATRKSSGQELRGIFLFFVFNWRRRVAGPLTCCMRSRAASLGSMSTVKRDEVVFRSCCIFEIAFVLMSAIEDTRVSVSRIWCRRRPNRVCRVASRLFCK